jgi:transcriptional regulator with XRE-family HTH domain
MPKRKKVKITRNAVGGTVARFRKSQGMTQADLAARAQVSGWDISTHSIQKIELGEREVTDIDLRRLAKALRVPTALLLDGI